MIRNIWLQVWAACLIAMPFAAGCGESPSATQDSGGNGGTQSTAGTAGQGGTGAKAGSGGSSSGATAGTGGTGGSGATGGTAGTAGTGGSGAPCQPLSDMCAQCSYNACQMQYCSCYAKPDCVVLVACLQACPVGDDACQQDCLSQPAAKDYISETFLLGDCASGFCAMECPGVSKAGVCPKCLFTNCAPQMNECLNDADCAEILKCALACPQGDLACAFGCAQGKPMDSTNKAVAVQQCSADPNKCKVDCGM